MMRAQQLVQEERNRRRRNSVVIAAAVCFVAAFAYWYWQKPTVIESPSIAQGLQKSDFDALQARVVALEDADKVTADALSISNTRIRALESRPVPVVQPVKQPEPQPVVLTGFVRDKSQALVDQLNNPGAMVMGERVRRYGVSEGYYTDNHEYAIFVDKPHGIAALIDLIAAFDGKSIRSYISGGEGTPAKKSYSGGDGDLIAFYLDVMSDRGLKPEFTIDIKDIMMVKAIVDTHAHAEGSRYFITDREFEEALAIWELSR